MAIYTWVESVYGSQIQQSCHFTWCFLHMEGSTVVIHGILPFLTFSNPEN